MTVAVTEAALVDAAAHVDEDVPEANDETVSDMVLAQLLQAEFDAEHDEQIRRREVIANLNNEKVQSEYNCTMHVCDDATGVGVDGQSAPRAAHA